MAYDGPGLVAPVDYPIRDPRSRPQMQGAVVNPVGYMQAPGSVTQGLGGLDAANKLPKHGGAQSVESPTSAKPAVTSSRGNSGLRKKS